MAKPIIHHSISPHRPRPSAAPPSAAALSVLAGILASSPAAAATVPAPPSFLCPSFAFPVPSSTIQAHSPPTSHHFRSRRSNDLPTRSRNLPYKFEPDKNGTWRYVEAYSLYGSTICPQTCRQPTSAVSADEVSTNSNATENIDLHDTLPAGWVQDIIHDSSRTTLILVLSLVLAFFICFFIIGCLLWRKTVRRKHKTGDIEMRPRRKRRTTSTMPSPAQAHREEQKKAKSKQKIWAKASARWREHARFTARLRRTNFRRSQLLDSTATLNPAVPIETPTNDVSSTQSLTPTPSRAVSPRPSSISLRDSPRPSLHHLPPETSDNPHTSPSLTVDSASDVQSSPPAYRRGTLLAPIAIPAENMSVPVERVGSALLASDPSPSHSSLNTSSVGTKSSYMELESSHALSPHGAHVATDDKALLARLTDLAERPPDDTSNEAEPSHLVSVPDWEDEQPADLMRASDPPDTDSSPSSSQCPFPPPPSKGKMAESSFYPYRYSFEDFSESIDPELEPCAPPFEAPSAPGLDDMVVSPSAPPMTEDEFPLEAFPNAPQLEYIAEGDGAQDSGAAESEGSPEHQLATNSRRPLSLPGYHP